MELTNTWPPRAKRSLFKHQEPDASTSRKQKQTDAEKKLAAAYAEVDTRDDSVCWVTGRKLSPRGTDEWKVRTHHHLKGRRVKPEWIDKPERIITVSLGVHKQITLGKLKVFGDDTRKPITFAWDASVKKQDQTFRILAARRHAPSSSALKRAIAVSSEAVG